MRLTERLKFRVFNISTLITGFMLFIMGLIALKYSPEGILGLIFAICGIVLGILLLIMSHYYHVKAKRLRTAQGDWIGLVN